MISYLERPSNSGHDDVTVVMFHGFTSSKNSNVNMTRHFPPNWRVILPDLPAHGDSSYIPNSDYSVHALVEILHEVNDGVYCYALTIGNIAIDMYMLLSFS